MTVREFRALSQYKNMASLVTEERRVPQAMRIVERQRGYMKKLDTNAIETALEKTIARSRRSRDDWTGFWQREIFSALPQSFYDRLQVTETTTH